MLWGDERGSEGRQRRISTLFVCAFQTEYCFYIRNISSWCVILWRLEEKKVTYSYYGRVVGHCRGFVFLDSGGSVLNLEILHIGAPENDVLVDLIRRRDFLSRKVPTLGTVSPQIFERNGRVVRVDRMQGTNISGAVLARV
jgi:hypothetical protein